MKTYKKKYLMQLSSASKIIMLTGSFVYGCLANAQSIVGKWKMTAAKETVTDPSGRKQDLTAQMGNIVKMIEQVIEFHADNTYFMQNKMVNAKSGIEASGKYGIAGNQLKLEQSKSNMPAVKPASLMNNQLPNIITIVSLNATTLVLEYGVTTTDDGKTFTMDIVDTFTKQ
jgi:hypothetical protein